jgi:hypothetical protein
MKKKTPKSRPINRIEFVFETDPSYKVLANGAMVGPTTRGEIKVDFFVECSKLPLRIVNEVTPTGLGKVIEREPQERGAVRRLQMGILLSQREAKDLGKLLIEKTEFLERMVRGEDAEHTAGPN